jgi:hypothetical protein
MPFTELLNDFWEIGIKETAEALGYECYRADSILQSGIIVDQIYRYIAEADLIIGVMTGRNPNVFYEIGFAHALGKPTVLLAPSKEDLDVFDTQGYRHCVYDGSIVVLRKRLNHILSNISLPEDILPHIPNSEVIYEWPAKTYPDPVLFWQNTDLALQGRQLDTNGGQAIINIVGVSKALIVTNTQKN